MKKKYYFRIHQDADNNKVCKAFLLTPQVILVEMLNAYPGFNQPNNVDLQHLIADVKLLTAFSSGDLQNNPLLNIQTDPEDGQLRIVEKKTGQYYVGDFNLEQLNVVKSPRIPWGLDTQYEIIIYGDKTEFYRYENRFSEKTILVGQMDTGELLSVLIEWNAFVEKSLLVN